MSKTKITPGFPERVVLAEGYPWAVGTRKYIDIRMTEGPTGMNPVWLNYPDKLWDRSVPKYRLVLERIKP